jgi:dTDP-4-dehydrorhamnose reductase
VKILITGDRGMLGRTLVNRLSDHRVAGADLPEADIADKAVIHRFIQSFQPDVVIHTAAMTAVDACETQRDQAFRVNALGSAHVAEAAVAARSRLIAVSTDYVFDGNLDRPYHEQDVPNPRTVYGQSKLAGERALQEICPEAAILRTGWLYGPGGPSFVHTMLRLGRDPGDPVRVVNDQAGNPTSTTALAELIAQFLVRHEPGVFHATCEGEATWYDLARAIFSIKGFRRALVPCTSREFVRPAPRPANSRLEKRALRLKGYSLLPDWKAALEAFLT